MADKVRVATWNMGGGETKGGPTLGETTELLQDVHELGVEIFLGQEAQENENLDILRDLGYRVFRARPESIVAWLPHWKPMARYDRVLNPNEPFFRPGSDNAVYIHMAHVILCNKEGVSLDAGSYHTPSSVQQKDAPDQRLAALREAMDTMGDLASNSKCRATLFGGDDNVDEQEGHGPWGFMLQPATGLRQIRPPRATLGKRKVDDFRVRNLQPMGNGKVLHGPTHHNVHIQTLKLPG